MASSSSILLSTDHNEHSAEVKMELLFNQLQLSVGQLGPNFLMLKDPVDHPAGDATLVVRIDQTERRWQVRLPTGISASSRRVAIENK
ncbi:MAG: hypothetical protein JO076_11235 [Verrucomicrobia bacterium]|nr:hypothetical protein [Verrucomicrobiota bacterium]